MARQTVIALFQPGGYVPPPPPAPTNLVLPSIDSASTEGVQNTGVRGTWDTAISYADQWQSSATGVGGWSDIVGATSLNYTPTGAVAGLYLRRRETATNAGGSTIAYSNVSGPVATTTMTFQVTTTGAAQVFAFNELRVTETVNVDWGDGTNNNYATGSHTPSRTYAAAGTYTVTIDKPLGVSHFDLRDAKTSQLTGANLSKLANLLNLRLLSMTNTVVSWTVSTTHPMPPNIQYLQLELHNNITWTIDSTNPIPPINDVLNLRGLPNVIWAHGSPSVIPPLVESLTIRDSPNIKQRVGIEAATDLDVVRIENGLLQAEVDDILARFYTAFPSRLKTAGTIDLLGSSNAAPSGVLAAMCPPTTGKARAYELVNDSCGVSANHWTSVTTA